MDTDRYEKEGLSGGVDNIGVKTIVIPYLAQTLEEAASIAKGKIIAGLPEDSRTFRADRGGLLQVDVVYRGKENPTSTALESEVQSSIDTSWAEEPIETHPKINEIVEKYAGEVDPVTKTVTFPRLYTPTKGSKGGLPGSSSSNQGLERNPFFGVSKYMKLSVVYTRTYAVSTIPGNILRRIGKVVSTPPGSPPELKGRTKWLVLPIRSNQRGNVFEIVESYQLLDENVPELLYDTAD